MSDIMKLGFGFEPDIGGSNFYGKVTDLFNGFSAGTTYTGGPTAVLDNLGVLQTSPANILPIVGGRLSGGVWLPTALNGSQLWPSQSVRTRKGSVAKYDSTFKGLLIEPERTNLADWSQDFSNTNWMGTATSVSSSAPSFLAPDGTMTACKVTENVGANVHRFGRLISAVGSVAGSVYAKAGERRYLGLKAGIVGAPEPVFDLQTGTLVEGVGSIQSVGNGWYRCSAIVVSTVRYTTYWTILASPTLTAENYTGDGTSGLYLWQADVVLSEFLTSPIKTLGAAVTRPASNVQRSTAGVLRPNDWGIWGRVVPSAAGQPAPFLFGLHLDANNYIGVYCEAGLILVTKRVAGGATLWLSRNLVLAAGVPFEYMIFQSSVYGIGIMVKQDGGAWSTWQLLNDVAGRASNALPSMYQMGAKSNLTHFAGTFPFTMPIMSMDPKAELERLAVKYP